MPTVNQLDVSGKYILPPLWQWKMCPDTAEYNPLGMENCPWHVAFLTVAISRSLPGFSILAVLSPSFSLLSAQTMVKAMVVPFCIFLPVLLHSYRSWSFVRRGVCLCISVSLTPNVCCDKKRPIGSYCESPKWDRLCKTRKSFVTTPQCSFLVSWIGPCVDHKGFFCISGLRPAIEQPVQLLRSLSPKPAFTKLVLGLSSLLR